MYMIESSTYDQEYDLLKRIKDGDKNAFETLYDQYHKDLFQMVFKIVKCESDTSDILHDFFMSLLSPEKNFQIQASLKAYLFTSLRNRTINYIRNHSKRLKLHESAAQFNIFLGNGDIATSHKIEMKEFTARITNEISKLPLNLKTIFDLSRNDGLTNLEIADKMELSHKTVRNRISMAIKILRHRLADLLIIYIAIRTFF
jgi:RNA polymerase sigma-70 factor, ECF subfamily